ncbi:MAG TPA: hypothetical protein VFN38_08180, partial [Gemmatimonadaceae bacterium]|nr:hypothetical protein [Gemmatimonadaceae bacterium]
MLRSPSDLRRLAAAVALLCAPVRSAFAQAPAGADSATRARSSRDSAQALEPVRVTVLRTPFDLSRA